MSIAPHSIGIRMIAIEVRWTEILSWRRNQPLRVVMRALTEELRTPCSKIWRNGTHSLRVPRTIYRGQQCLPSRSLDLLKESAVLSRSSITAIADAEDQLTCIFSERSQLMYHPQRLAICATMLSTSSVDVFHAATKRTAEPSSLSIVNRNSVLPELLDQRLRQAHEHFIRSCRIGQFEIRQSGKAFAQS